MNWYKQAIEEEFFGKRGLSPANANLTEWFLVNGYTLTGHGMPDRTPLKRCVDWPELYEKYPALDRVTVRITMPGHTSSAKALTWGVLRGGVPYFEFYLNPETFFGKYGETTTPSKMLRSFVHEITHVILFEEGKRGTDFGSPPGPGHSESQGEQQAGLNAKQFPEGKWPDDWSYTK